MAVRSKKVMYPEYAPSWRASRALTATLLLIVIPIVFFRQFQDFLKYGCVNVAMDCDIPCTRLHMQCTGNLLSDNIPLL